MFKSPDDAMSRVYEAMCSDEDQASVRWFDLAARSVSQYPDNYRLRMLYAMALDEAFPDKTTEAAKEFVKAIQFSTDLEKEVFTGWPEENVTHHLGINALKQKNSWRAAFFFLCSGWIVGSRPWLG